ncbi:sensor histidine kinase [Niabella sp. CJ426]|uniref:sensor histidine kinase n=1 Tax=Niabella sp. CJ426 TaxID=3393740 RepID=UPI003CFCD02C
MKFSTNDTKSGTHDKIWGTATVKVVSMHALAIILFVGLEMAMLACMQINPLMVDTLLTYLVYFAAFYLNAYFLYPRISERKPVYVLLLIVALALQYTLVLLVNICASTIKFTEVDAAKAYAFHVKSIYRLMCFYLYSLGLYFALRSIKKAKENAALATARLELENAYLRAQINPHLLFNTLNFVYASITANDQSAGPAVLKLAQIMEYALKPVGTDGKGLLADELHYLEEYISLNRLRLGNRMQLQYNIDQPPEELRVPPLLLITLVENVFKHGVVTDAKCPAQIFISFTAGTMMFKSSNAPQGEPATVSMGMGLDNVKKRLGNYYDSYSLTTKDVEGDFIVELIIAL